MNPEITWSTLHAAESITADRLLLNEITHRVSNELQTAIGIAAVEIARAGSEEITLSLVRIKRCLEGFARVHQVLRIPQPHTRVDACAYLRALCAAISGARLEPFGIDLQLVERPLRLDSEHCWKLGVIVTELVTNVSRHAFGSLPGRITVEAWCANTAVQCSVSDNGGGPRRRTRGPGLRIVEALLRGLDGSLEEQTGVEGSLFKLSFPDAAACPGRSRARLGVSPLRKCGW